MKVGTPGSFPPSRVGVTGRCRRSARSLSTHPDRIGVLARLCVAATGLLDGLVNVTYTLYYAAGGGAKDPQDARRFPGGARRARRRREELGGSLGAGRARHSGV